MAKPNKLQRGRRRSACDASAAAVIVKLLTGDIEDDTKASMRASVLRGRCPLCGESGFSNTALHIQLMHGLRRREFSDLVGFTYTESICAADLSASCASRSEGRNPRGRKTPGPPKHISRRGREIHLANIKPYFDRAPKQILQELGRRVGSANKGQRRSPIEHGTMREYRKGCRCSGCVQGHRQYWAVFREKRRAEKLA